jgi:hypothetical protein
MKCELTVVRPSDFQDDDIHALVFIGLQPQEEMLMLSNVKVNGINIGVEVDGPPHFTDRLPNSRTIFKRHLGPTIDGAIILLVPYWKWEAIKTFIQGGRNIYLVSWG